jgi:Mn-containing catalase
MFFHQMGLQFEAKPDAPDPIYAAKLQELLGGAWGEITVAMQYLFQGWNCRMPGKYKDMLMDIGTEELAHVEMLANMIGQLLEGAPLKAQEEALASNPALAAVIGGMNVQAAIVGGGGATPSDSAGVPWNGRYIVASGNLLADFRANVAAESQGRLQAIRLYEMTDDRGVKDLLSFMIARDTMHQNQWLAAIEQLKEDGLEQTPCPSDFPPELENQTYSYQYWACSGDGASDSKQGRWASGPSMDGRGKFEYVAKPAPLAKMPPPPKSEPKLYLTGRGGMMQKVIDKVTDPL